MMTGSNVQRRRTSRQREPRHHPLEKESRSLELRRERSIDEIAADDESVERLVTLLPQIAGELRVGDRGLVVTREVEIRQVEDTQENRS